MPPADPDWYYVRAASIARKIYLNGGIGVGALAHWYGKAKAPTCKPQHHHSASRAVIRHILIQLEKLGVVEQTEKGGRKVRGEMRWESGAAATSSPPVLASCPSAAGCRRRNTRAGAPMAVKVAGVRPLSHGSPPGRAHRRPLTFTFARIAADPRRPRS
jgi:hypothetical protein